MLSGMTAELSQLVADPARVLSAPAVLDRLSHDFYWYSPVLRPLLATKTGDVAVQPINTGELLAILRFAGRHEIPVTPRGADVYKRQSSCRFRNERNSASSMAAPHSSL